MTNFKKRKIVIATGGTGGHIFPAYSLARYFIEKKQPVEIVTDKRGFKYLQKYQDLNITINNSTTIFKKNIIKKIYSFIIILFSFFKGLIFLNKTKPKLVFGMGGYSSFPICLASKILKIPFIIYENNLITGKANKYLLPIAYKIFVAYPEVHGINKKYKSKIFLTGNILRKEIFDFNKDNKKLNNDILSILVLGGSQAAKAFGELLPNIFKKCLESGIKLKIYQQCTESQNLMLENFYKLNNIDYELFNFSNNILKYFYKIDFAITRSGSSMISELLNCSVPFISIPFPYAAEDHQLYNAKYFEEKGYSFLIKENEINSNLFALIKSIHNDKNLLKQMSIIQNKHSDKETFKKISNEIENFVNEEN